MIVREGAAAWIRSRPPAVREMIRRFPPGCIVEGTRPLMIPAPGRRGEVVSYTEDISGRVGLTVAHVDDDDPDAPRGACDPDWLRVVAYTDGLTSEWVASVLATSGEKEQSE